MRTMIFLLVLSLLLARCGSAEPSDSAIQTAIAQTQEAQAPGPIDEGTPAAAETAPTIDAGQPEPTPLPPTLEPTQPAESQELQPQPDVPSLLWSTRAVRYAIADGKIIVESGEDQIKAFDVMTGENLWVVGASGKLLMADPDMVYTRPSKLRVDALDAKTGEYRWRHLSQETVRPVVVTDKFVVVSDESQVGGYDLSVIDKSTGAVIFTTSIQAYVPPVGWAFQGNSFIPRDTNQPRGCAQVLESGRIEWLITDLAFGEFCDEMLVYFSSSQENTPSNLEAIDLNTGELVWRSDLALEAYDDVQMFRCQARNIEMSVNNRTVAISKETGQLQWKGLVHNTIDQYSVDTPYWLGEVDDMVIYVNVGFGLTQAYDAVDHTLIWENRQVVLQQIVGISEDILIASVWPQGGNWASFPEIIVGLDPATGSELWRSEPGRMWRIQMLEGRLLYLLDGKRGIHFFDPQSGALSAEIASDIRFENSPFSADGMIVAHSPNDDELVVIRP